MDAGVDVRELNRLVVALNDPGVQDGRQIPILGAAYLDDLMAAALTAFLTELAGTVPNPDLFDPVRPGVLGTAGARRQMLLALGRISQPWARALAATARVRNAAAHTTATFVLHDALTREARHLRPGELVEEVRSHVALRLATESVPVPAESDYGEHLVLVDLNDRVGFAVPFPQDDPTGDLGKDLVGCIQVMAWGLVALGAPAIRGLGR